MPNVNSAAQARQAAGACRVPAAGYRSGGGAMTGGRAILHHHGRVRRRRSPTWKATLAQDGVDGIYVGPRDLSYSLGCELDPDDPV